MRLQSDRRRPILPVRKKASGHFQEQRRVNQVAEGRVVRTCQNHVFFRHIVRRLKPHAHHRYVVSVKNNIYGFHQFDRTFEGQRREATGTVPFGQTASF